MKKALILLAFLALTVPSFGQVCPVNTWSIGAPAVTLTPLTGERHYVICQDANGQIYLQGVASILPLFVDGTCYAANAPITGDAGAKIAYCIGLLPVTGGTVDAQGLKGAQTITATIAVAKPVTILFGASPDAAPITVSAFPVFSITSPGVKLLGLGSGQSVIKVIDNAGIYRRLAYANFAGSGLEIAGLTFNHNVANNPRSAGPVAGGANGQLTVQLDVGTHIRIHNNEIKNTSSVNNVVPNGPAVQDVWITDNLFTNVGNDAGLKGTHTGANNAAVLTDAAASWTVNGLVGTTISIANLTDISTCVITANTANTVTCALAGGTDNDWDAGDVYTISCDSSVIYTHATDVLIRGNILKATTAMDPGAWTAIETHGSNQTVADNQARNFLKGANISGIALSDSTGILVTNNVFDNVGMGISLWSVEYGAHVVGFGIDGAMVSHNTINLGGKAVFISGSEESGIAIVTDATELDVRGLIIESNIISHPLEAVGVTNSANSKAIGWRSSANKTLYDSRISNNVIVNFPMAAIRLSCGISNVAIEGNTLTNVGSTLDPAAVEAYRDPIFIGGRGVSGLRISNNLVQDNIANTRFLYAVNIQAAVATPSDVQVEGNTFNITGAKNANFRYVLPVRLGAVDILPLLRGAISDFGSYLTIGATQLFTLGSRVLETSTGSVYQVATNTYTWTRVEDGASGALQPLPVTFATLPAPVNGMITYCSDCTIANPCAAAGAGAFAKRLNGIWVCN